MAENFWDFAATRIAAFSFRDIDDSYDEKSIGWVSVASMFDSEFAYASYAVGDYVTLSLRIDERKVSPAVLKKFSLKEEERIKKERQIPYISKGQRQSIKENIRLMLMKKAVPVASVYDLAWNLSSGTLYFFSTNPKAQEILEDVFKETFGLLLVRQIPYHTASHLLTPGELEALADISAEILV